MNKNAEVRAKLSAAGMVHMPRDQAVNIFVENAASYYDNKQPPAGMKAGGGLNTNLKTIALRTLDGETPSEIKAALPRCANPMTPIMIVRQQKLLGLCDCSGHANGAGGHAGRKSNCTGCESGRCQNDTVLQLNQQYHIA